MDVDVEVGIINYKAQPMVISPCFTLFPSLLSELSVITYFSLELVFSRISLEALDNLSTISITPEE